MTSTFDDKTLLDQILLAIERDEIVLPTLPNIAVKVQELLDDPNVSAGQIVSVLSSDPFISAHIIKSANSATYAGKPQIDNVRDAASRLGYRQLRNLVINITMSKMLYSNNHIINQRMMQIWNNSREVAVVCHVLASRLPHLSPDQAMLAGLMHNIGVLPLFQYIEKNQLPITEETLVSIETNCSGIIGAKLLKKWNFPEDIIEAVTVREDIHRNSTLAPLADYSDVLIFSNLQICASTKMFAWDNFAAVNRLGLSKYECLTFLEHNATRIEQVKELLGMNTPPSRISIGSPPSTNITNPQQKSFPTEKKSGIFSFLRRLWKS